MRRLLTIFPLLVELFLIVSVLPVPTPAAAQDDNCPEGLVYYPEGEICLLPENVPTDDTAEEPSDDTDDAVEDDLTDEGDDTSDEDLSEDGSDSATKDGEDVADEVMDDSGDMEDMEEEPVDEPSGTIVNLTLTSYACPALWDPAAKGVDESLAGCTATPGAELTYSILYAGTEQLISVAPADFDLAGAGVPLMAGTWTIRENGGESDPYAACTITAADGSVSGTIQQTVPGGSLDVELGDGEALDCQWFSTRELATLVGEGSGAIPSLTVTSGFCPYGIGNYYGHYMWSIDDHKALCLEDPATVAYSLLYGETNVSSQTTTDALPVDMVQASAELVTSGTYRLIANVPNPFVMSLGACIVTEVTGTTRYVEQDFLTEKTLTPEIVLDLNPGETVACWWYFMNPVVGTGPLESIDITSYVCPFGITHTPDLFDPSTETICTTPPPVPIFMDFLLNDQVIGSGSFVNSPSIMSVTDNGEPPNAGKWTLRLREIPAGWDTNWYCNAYLNVPGDETRERQIDVDQVQPDALTFQSTLGPNHRLRCRVILTKPVADDFIKVRPHRCEDGVDPAALASGDRLAQCSRTPSATFQILISDQVVAQQGNSITGVMAPLTPGLLRIETTSEPGKTLRVVSCDVANSGTPGQVQTIEPSINTENGVSITLDAKAGDQIVCDWYYGDLPPAAETMTEPDDDGEDDQAQDDDDIQAPNDEDDEDIQVPNGGGEDNGQASTLIIVHWNCLDPIAADARFEDLLLSCTPVPDGSTVDNLPPGPHPIAVDGNASPLVFCGSDGAGDNDAFPALVPFENGAVTIVIPSAATVYCDWFAGP